MASLLSLDGAGPIKMHTLLNLYIAITIGCIVKWTKMEESAQLVAAIEKTGCSSVKHFALVWVIIVWVTTFLVSATGLASTRKKGYNNIAPRSMTDPSSGWMFRAKSANDNALECMVFQLIAVVISDKLSTGSEMDALHNKFSSLLIVARTVYPVVYVFKLDHARTFIWGFGFWSSLLISLTSLFPAVAELI